MGDWDPFADPAGDDGGDANETPSNAVAPAAEKTTAASSAQVEEDDMFETMFEGGLATNALPPEPSRNIKEVNLTLEDFMKKLNEAAEAEEGRASAILSKLSKDAKSLSDGNQTMMFATILVQRVARQMQALQSETDEKAPGVVLLLSLKKAADDILASRSDEFVVVRPDQPFDGRPAQPFSGRVVLLFGWGGSNGGDLLPDCVPFYASQDPGALIVVLVMSGIPELGRAQIARALETIVNAWADTPEARPMLHIHLFSNLGFQTWTAFLKLWKEQNADPDTARLRGPVLAMSEVLQGVILDSAPDGYILKSRGIQSMINASAAMLGGMVAFDADGKPLDQRGQARASITGKTLVLEENCPLKRFIWDKMTEKEVHASTRAETAVALELEPPVQLLFIYSEADQIIAASGVERYIEECENRPDRSGLATRRLKYEQTPHCFHKKINSMEYWETVKSFWEISQS